MEKGDDPPRPVVNNLYLTEVTGPVKVNITTIDSTDPSDYYTKLIIYCICTYLCVIILMHPYSSHYFIIMKLHVYVIIGNFVFSNIFTF